MYIVDGWERAGLSRPAGLYVLLASSPHGSMGAGVQDNACKMESGREGCVCMVSLQSTPVDSRAARRPHQATARPLQLFGVNGNVDSLIRLVVHAKRAWFKWLNRRSQRSRLNWERFADLYRDYPLPTPRRVVQLWSG